MRKIALLSLLGLAFLPAGAVHALGLGEIQLRSALNQPLDAEIDLLSVRQGETEGMLVSLAPQEAFLRAGLERPFMLTQLRFAVELKPDGTPYIRVTTRKPIVEPFLNFLVEVDWPRGRLLKEYTVLLDPPVFLTEMASAGTPEAPVAGAETGGPAPGVPAAIVRSEPEPLPVPAPVPAPMPAPMPEPAPLAQAPEPLPAFAEPEAEIEPPEPEPAAETTLAAAPADGELFPRVDVANEYDAARNPLPGASGAGMAGAPAFAGDSYGPVARNESLWSIARRVKPEAASVNQMMLALLRYNPEAFFQDNINSLKQGVVLRVPEESAVLEVGGGDATAEVKAQNALWEQVRQVAVAAPPATTEQPVSETAGGAPSIAATETGDSSRLALVADEQGAESASSVASTSGAGAAEEALQKELALAREELAAERLQNQDMRDRVGELESIVANVESLITLRENQIAELQARLAELEQGVAAPTQPMTQEPALQPETTAPVTPEPTVSTVTAPEPVSAPEPAPAPMPAPEPAPAPEPVQPVQPVQPTAPATLPPRAAQPRGFFEQLMSDVSRGRFLENPALLGMVGGLVILLGLALWLLMRRRGAEEAVEVDAAALPDQLDLDEGDIGVDALDDTLEELDEAIAEPAEEPVDIETVVSDMPGPMEETIEALPDVGDAEDAPKDDTIAEADVYLAYGLYSQSEDLLKQALAEHPERHEYHEKLLETYFASNNQDAFEQHAEVFQQALGGRPSRLWDRVVAMGGELCPGNPLFSGAADLDISVKDMQPAKPETPDLELDSEEVTPDLDFGMDEEEAFINTGTDFDTGEIPVAPDETIHEEDELEATHLLSETPTINMDEDVPKGDTADHMDLDTAEVEGVHDEPTMALDGDLEFDITSSDLDELGTATDSYPSTPEAPAEEDEEGLVLTSGEHPAVMTGTAEYDMSKLDEDEDTGEQPERRPQAVTEEMLAAAAGDDDDEAALDATMQPDAAFEDDPGPNYNMGGTAEIPVMDDVDDFELDLDTGAAEDEEAPSVVSQLVSSVAADDMLDEGEDDEGPRLVSEIMPSITDDMLDKTVVQDSSAFRGEEQGATREVEESDEVETMLDLAKAYLDMGDSDSATSALEEIIAAGNDRQKQEAQELLQKIS